MTAIELYLLFQIISYW